MKIWLDAQLSPLIAQWLCSEYEIEAIHVRDLNLREASDERIFSEARLAKSAVLTKDSDFVKLVEQLGIPPQVIWITCGNTSNENLKIILKKTFTEALKLLANGEQIIEITEA